MIEMPPLQFAQVNGIRMGFYEAGPKTDKPPLVLCHGWPELAFSWRHQIKALSEAGIRVIAPDQRGYGSPTHIVEAPADEREPVRGQIDDRRGEVELTKEPRFHGVQIRGLDIEQVIRHQGPHMAVDHFIHDGVSATRCRSPQHHPGTD